MKRLHATALLLLLGVVRLSAGVPIPTVVEKWDSYAPGTADPEYNRLWQALPGAERYAVEPGPFGSATVWSPPNGLKIGKLRTYGISRDLTPEIALGMPQATVVVGTDEDVLRVRFNVDFNSLNQDQEDIFVELSRGDVHADETSGTTRSVVAFGMTYGWFGSSQHPRIYDGTEWIVAEGVTTDRRSNHFTLEIATETLTLVGGQRASGSHEVLRSYLGGFDRITVRTIQQNDQAHMLDDLEVSGGDVVEESAPGAPSLVSVEPAEGPPAGGTEVTIAGENFADGAEVYFGGVTADDVSVVSATGIVCSTPNHAQGAVHVRVTNPDGQSGLLRGGFLYRGSSDAKFHRGDSDGDGAISITDAVRIFGFLFLGGTEPGCLEAANPNDDGKLDITDGIYILSFLFVGGEGPVFPGPPGGPCGSDPAEEPADGLDCEEYPPCQP